MSETPTTESLLDQLDRRQDEVMCDIDDLNGRIEALLKEWLPSSGGEAQG